MSVDTLLREAVQNGLAGLTLYPTQDGRWQASTTVDRLGWSITVDDDPATAIVRALSTFAVSEMKTNNDDAGDIFG
ncbi:hypothetical protein [Rhizobium phaseoli]|uniref:hypothetical protein n=1 Tax=Rhizobium phaseoli TaxID=396 RepID=UPI0025557E22|nr:hypothetical protein [Rhizobium phaseoli]MDK4730527.1 hypothetical protein [Rhizobium phaseoli]